MVRVPDDPVGRERLLQGIRYHRAAAQHELLREIFRAEMAHRRAGGDDSGTAGENIYWCAFLLYLVGDVTDVPMMWEAKHIDFDIGAYFDWQCMLGAGPEATLEYLHRNGYPEIAEAVARYVSWDEDLAEWEAFRRTYYRPGDTGS